MHIQRSLFQQIRQDLTQGDKLVVLYGARQVGKTTLARKVIAEVSRDLSYKPLIINAEQTKFQSILSSRDLKKLSQLIGQHQLLFIDEAQYIEQIGLNLKLIHDHLPQVKVLVSGSSSFDLANKLSEPLTGRAWKYTLYPIAYLELAQTASGIYQNEGGDSSSGGDKSGVNRTSSAQSESDMSLEFALRDQLEERLIYGSYPELVTIQGYQQKQKYLQQLINAYLFKDIFTFANIKHHTKIKRLLKLIAFQVGSLVSIQELAQQLAISRDAVENYIDLLEKSFVLFRLSGFSRNLRKEVSKMDKIYFYDLGVRNAIIDNFNLPAERQDVGGLWENFLIAERLKRNSYLQHFCSSYFWRLHSGAEIDYVEEYGGKLYGYEFKWSKKRAREPRSWRETYSQAQFQVIHQDNFLQFVLKPHFFSD
jgi:hypothetical protein